MVVECWWWPTLVNVKHSTVVLGIVIRISEVAAEAV